MPTPRLSVVVPFYNVQEYVVPCLASLARQTFPDLEVVLVDDGSQDASRDRVQAFIADDPRFRLVTQENQGLGPARNTGILHAQGEMLAFIDSDDLVPRRAFASLVRSLEETGSDFAAGNARRFNTLGVRQSFAHRNAFAEDRPATSIREFAELGLDRMAWNKVYRRRFWDEHGLAFPAMLYEDYPVSIAAHLHADRVDVLSEPVCYWRERDGGEPSITQRTWHLANLQDRVDSGIQVIDQLEQAGLPEVLERVGQHLLHIDVSAVVGALHQNDPSEHEAILAMAQQLLARIPRRARDLAGRFDGLQADLIERGLLRELETLEDYRADHGMDGRIRSERVRRGPGGLLRRRRLVMELPFEGQGVVPQETFELPEDYWKLRPTLSDGHWADGSLHLDIDLGVAPLPAGADAKVRIWLDRDGQRVELPVERYEKATLKVGRDLSGARVVIDPFTLPGWDQPGFWTIHVGVRTPDVRGQSPLQHVTNNRARYLPAQWLHSDVAVLPCRRNGAIGLLVRRPQVVVEHATALHEEIELRGWLAAPVGGAGAADLAADLAVAELDGTVHRFDALVEPQAPEGWRPDLRRWTARVPADLLVHVETFDPVEERERFGVTLHLQGEAHPLVVGQRFAAAEISRGWRSLLATRSPVGQLVLLTSAVAPRLVDVGWTGPGRLRLRGVWMGPGEMPDEVLLRCYPNPLLPLERRLPVHTADGVFTFEVDWLDLAAEVDAHPQLRDQRFHAQPWTPLVEIDGTLVTMVLTRDLPSSMPAPQVLDEHVASLMLDREDVVRLMVRRR